MDTDREDLIFEEIYTKNNIVRDRNRIRKFLRLLDQVKLSWDAKFTVVDMFPTLENFFDLGSNRTNFINLEQTGYFLCEMLGYPEECHKFRQLKTISRRNLIKRYIEKAIGKIIVINRIRDFPLIPLGDDSIIVCPKAIPNTVFVDLKSKKLNKN